MACLSVSRSAEPMVSCPERITSILLARLVVESRFMFQKGSVCSGKLQRKYVAE